MRTPIRAEAEEREKGGVAAFSRYAVPWEPQRHRHPSIHARISIAETCHSKIPSRKLSAIVYNTVVVEQDCASLEMFNLPRALQREADKAFYALRVGTMRSDRIA